MGELRLIKGMVTPVGNLFYGPDQEPIPLVHRSRSLGLDTTSPGYVVFNALKENDIIIVNQDVGVFLKEHVQTRVKVCVAGEMPATLLSEDWKDWAVSGLQLL